MKELPPMPIQPELTPKELDDKVRELQLKPMPVDTGEDRSSREEVWSDKLTGPFPTEDSAMPAEEPSVVEKFSHNTNFGEVVDESLSRPDSANNFFFDGKNVPAGEDFDSRTENTDDSEKGASDSISSWSASSEKAVNNEVGNTPPLRYGEALADKDLNVDEGELERVALADNNSQDVDKKDATRSVFGGKKDFLDVGFETSNSRRVVNQAREVTEGSLDSTESNDESKDKIISPTPPTPEPSPVTSPPPSSKTTKTPPPPLPENASATPAPMPTRTPLGPPPIPRPLTPGEMPARVPMSEPLPSTTPGFNPNSGAPENINSLLGRIDRANNITREAGNNMEIGSEINWLTSAFNKLKIKMGWSADVINYAKLSTVDKITMGVDNWSNDSLVIRKKSELTRLDRRIQKELSNPTNERLARENVNRIEESIKEAEARGDQNMVRTLIEARNSIVENEVNRRDHLQAERQALAEQLGRYNEKKISIVNNFIASVEIETEKVRQNTRYHENVANLRTINTETNRMLGIIAETDSQLISLKKALANTKDRVDKAEIKGAIKEYEATIKESKSKLGFYEDIGHRLGSFIELTDKRTKRFDDLRDKYVKQRDNSQAKINNGGVLQQTPPTPRPAPAPAPTPKPTPAPAPATPEPTPATPEPTPKAPKTPEIKDPEAEKRRGEKLPAIRRAAEEFRQIFRSDNKSSIIPSLIQQKAEQLGLALSKIQTDNDFSESERRLFKAGGTRIVGFLEQMNRDKGVITEDNKKFIKDKSSIFDNIIKLS